MYHEMILLSADLKSVHARLARKVNATLADRAMRVPRKDEDSGSIPESSSTSEEKECSQL